MKHELTTEQAADVLRHRDAIFAAESAMLESAGFVRCGYNSQWVCPGTGESFWPDGAMRVAEAMAMSALGQNPNHGRMP
jgi:hypothetical protein